MVTFIVKLLYCTYKRKCKFLHNYENSDIFVYCVRQSFTCSRIERGAAKQTNNLLPLYWKKLNV